MLKELYERTLNAPYVHIGDQTASYCTEREGGTLFIFFQHSNGATDWRNNLDFPAKPYRDMKNKWYAHRGFLRVWKVIEPYLQPKICDLSVNNIVISGYSHGAGIAVLCHEYCKFNRPDINITGFGFGAPRVVWGFLRKAVRKRFEGFTVIRNGCDIVTSVPPKLFGYRHIGKMIHIGRNKGYTPIVAHYPEVYRIELEYWEKEREQEEMIIYEFNNLFTKKGEMYSITPIKVAEKEKTYMSADRRINKAEIDKLSTNHGCRMYRLDDNPEPYINALIEHYKNVVEISEGRLTRAKATLAKWVALAERGENEE